VLLGPDAGRGRAQGAALIVEQTIRDTGHDVADITGSNPAMSRAAARAAVAEGAERIIVVGGDGMTHLALQAVAGSDTVLGVVPVGTGNDFARAFEVGDAGDVRTAAARALGPPRPIDAIHTDRGWVASVATAGFSGDVIARAGRLPWPRGPRRYTAATVLEIARLASRELRLVVDGQGHDLDLALLAVANTAWFGGGMQICPAARPDDGLLDVTTVGRVGRIELLTYLPRVFSGAHLDHPKTTTYRGRTVRVECDGLDMWGDGESLGTGSITFTAVPGAVNLAI
jgi:diacylglycerol kinase (ATP)